MTHKEAQLVVRGVVAWERADGDPGDCVLCNYAVQKLERYEDKHGWSDYESCDFCPIKRYTGQIFCGMTPFPTRNVAEIVAFAKEMLDEAGYEIAEK